jgi:hypothetical protein
MSDRAILFLFSIVVIAGSLATAGWLLASGQAASLDGIFLLLTCLLVAFAFGLYVMFLIRRAMQAPEPAVAKTAAAAKSAAPAQPKAALATADKPE